MMWLEYHESTQNSKISTQTAQITGGIFKEKASSGSSQNKPRKLAPDAVQGDTGPAMD